MGAEKHTFYLYGQGEPEDILCLGNLVVKDPRNPRVPGRHWTAGVLDDTELRDVAYTTQLQGEFKSREGVHFGILVEAADLVNIDLSWTRNKDKIVTANAGRRVILRDPQNFLNSRILQNPRAQEEMRLWLATSNLIKPRRKAKIWMCTGIYVLAGASVHEIYDRTPNAEVCLSSTTLAALLSIPVGGSLSLGPSKSIENKLATSEQLVWAAQWRLLDVKYIRSPKERSDLVLPGTIRLLPDIVGNATLRGDEQQSAQISFASLNGQDVSEELVKLEEVTTEDKDDWDMSFDELLQSLRELHRRPDRH